MSLTDDDRAYLATVTVSVAPGRDLDVVSLVAAWRAHVAGLASAPVPAYIATLCLRDWIAQASALLPPDLRHRLDATVAETDRRFLALTGPDVDGRVERAADDHDPTHDWWWHRMPLAWNMNSFNR